MSKHTTFLVIRFIIRVLGKPDIGHETSPVRSFSVFGRKFWTGTYSACIGNNWYYADPPF